MSVKKLRPILQEKLDVLKSRGALKGGERVITGWKAASDGSGPRCFLAGHGSKEFLRMNSNSYLDLAAHPAVIAAEEECAAEFGTGPGAVRFISGTHAAHADLEKKLAHFHNRAAAMLMSSAYATVMGVLPQLISEETAVISDALNHNSIINAIRLAKPCAKAVYRHLDMHDFSDKLLTFSGKARRILVVTDGIFSMRGDHAPLHRLIGICKDYEGLFPEGIITVVDDSHGVGAFGLSGRGTEEYCDARADILIATLGKALGVNGGYVTGDDTVIRFLRETSPFYVYSNPITPSEASAAGKALDILDSNEGLGLLARLRTLTRLFEEGLTGLGGEIIASEHPIVPLLIRDTQKTALLVRYLFDNGILATGLNYPVVPRGDEEIRFQLSAGHTEKDVEFVLNVLRIF